MSGDEDDYLSDKFLVDAAPAASAAPKTYAERRKDAQRRSAQRNADGRTLSRAERERAAREEGLARSLFDRAREEAAEGSGQQNKALAMMMKMGFKPGQALGADEGQGGGKGKREEEEGGEGGRGDDERPRAPQVEEAEPVRAGIGARRAHDAVEAAVKAGPSSHRTVPLAINEWQGAH